MMAQETTKTKLRMKKKTIKNVKTNDRNQLFLVKTLEVF